MTWQEFEQDHPARASAAMWQVYEGWGDVLEKIIMDRLPADHPSCVRMRGVIAEARMEAMQEFLEAQVL